MFSVDLRSTRIITNDGLDVIIPNKEILQNPLVNYTNTDDRRVDLSVGVSYAEDLDKVKDVTENCIKSLKETNKAKGFDVFFTEFSDSSINLIMRFWIKKSLQKEFLKARSDAIISIKKAYDKEGITIPFPIRTLDFGIKGGKTLSEMKKY